MLAILTTHPIQYQVPQWQELARRDRIPFEVWYLSDHGSRPRRDPGFGTVFRWDLDLLDGYPYRFLATRPSQANITAFRGARLSSLVPLLRERDIRVLWINGWQVQAYWQAAFQAYRAGVRVWLRGETNDLGPSVGAKRMVRRLLLGQLFRRVDRFLTIGSANRRLYRSFGIPEHRLVDAPYCVDNARFADAARRLSPERARLRAEWGIPEGATCFLFCGKFIPKKRPLDLLAAARRLAEQGAVPRFHLLFVGDGELRETLLAEAKELSLRIQRPVATFAGFLNQTEIPRAYAAADCLVLPSDSGETWGLVVNEALASGRPALVSDRCGCAEDLARPLGGEFVFPCGSVEALTGAMAAALNRPTDSVVVRRCASIIEQFDLGRTIDSIVASYHDA